MRGGWAKAGSTLAVLAASEEARGICLGSSARGVWLQWERLVGRPVLGKEQQAARALGPPAPATCGEGLRGPPRAPISLHICPRNLAASGGRHPCPD